MRSSTWSCAPSITRTADTLARPASRSVRPVLGASTPRRSPAAARAPADSHAMAEVVIIDAVRTPIGKRNGGLSEVHPADLLGTVLTELVARAGIDPSTIGQVVGGCVSQVGEQSFNIARTAWLASGLPQSVAATTVDSQCGSSQQATNLATSLVGAGVVDVALACGVEIMSRVPIGSASQRKLGLGTPVPKMYFGHYELTS